MRNQKVFIFFIPVTKASTVNFYFFSVFLLCFLRLSSLQIAACIVYLSYQRQIGVFLLFKRISVNQSLLPQKEKKPVSRKTCSKTMPNNRTVSRLFVCFIQKQKLLPKHNRHRKLQNKYQSWLVFGRKINNMRVYNGKPYRNRNQKTKI